MTIEPRLELYGAMTGNSLRAAIALEEAGLPYRARIVSLRTGAHHEPEFLALNPAGKVPVLVDSTVDSEPFVMTQSNAIMFYAAERSGGRLLPQSNPRARALALERFFFFLTDVIAFNHAAFALRRNVDAAASRATLGQRVLAALHYAERFAESTPYIAGEQFSIADIAAVTLVSAVASDIGWDELPHLHRWFERTRNRNSVEQGMRVFASQ